MKTARFSPSYSDGLAVFAPDWASPVEGFAAPTGLIGTPTNTSIVWTWMPAPTATGYQIEHGVPGGPYTLTDVGNVTSFEQTGLSGATSYEARVRAYR